ncbi:hypothetical protein ACP6PL_01035 [Dapis sp. BLCC M126]|uniref:hypothetical protein n=1 Tax=Dapis sp. BLCC M126 TaxID=3400189 RepID=UPI003CEA7B89
METIKLTTRVDRDGNLTIQLPKDLADRELEIILVYQQNKLEKSAKTPEELGWPPGFFEKTAGCLADENLVRYSPCEYENRETIEQLSFRGGNINI